MILNHLCTKQCFEGAFDIRKYQNGRELTDYARHAMSSAKDVYNGIETSLQKTTTVVETIIQVETSIQNDCRPLTRGPPKVICKQICIFLTIEIERGSAEMIRINGSEYQRDQCAMPRKTQQ